MPSDPDATPPKDQEVADAGLLFREEAERPATTPSAAVGPRPAEDAYAIEGGDAPLPAASEPPPITTRPNKPAGQSTKAELLPAARVDQVWSRAAEWGGSLALLIVVGLAFAGLIYLTFDVENLGLTFFLLLVGGAALLVLSYPMAVTLERPVRMTPEHAVRDFYGALAHHRPHFKRMWLVLSSSGRTSSEYGSLEGFKRYWRGRLAELRGGEIAWFTPLVFQVHEFKAEKSAGKSALPLAYTVSIFARGRQSQPPLASIRVKSSAVRGPDNMWYLNDGTLPLEENAAAAS